MGCYRTTSQVLWVWTSVAFVTLQLPNALSKPVVLYAHSFVISTRLSAVTCCRLTSVPEFTQRALNTPNPCVSAPTAPVMSQSPLLMPECMSLCAALKELLPFTSSVQVRPVSLCFAQSHRHSSATTLHCSKPLHLQYLYGDYSSCCCIQVLFLCAPPGVTAWLTVQSSADEGQLYLPKVQTQVCLAYCYFSMSTTKLYEWCTANCLATLLALPWMIVVLSSLKQAAKPM